MRYVIAVAAFVMIFFFFFLVSTKNENQDWKSQNWTDHKIEKFEEKQTPPVDESKQEILQPIKKQITANNYNDAIAKSKEYNLPIFIIFHADWCHWCKELEHKTLSNASVKDMMKNYVFLSIDTDRDQQTTSKFGVRGLPAYMIVDSVGKSVKNGSGYRDVNSFKKWLNN